MVRRQCSPTFRPALALIGAADGNRPFSVYADDRHGPTHRGTQARAAAQRASSIGWCDGSHGALRKGQTALKIQSNKGLPLPSAPVKSANSSIQGSQKLRRSQQVAASDRPFRAGILKPAIPGRAEGSSLRQLAVSPNPRSEPEKEAPGDLLLFRARRGGPIRESRFVQDHFKPLLRSAELPAIRLYDLRHTAATISVIAGVSPKVISEQLGHASVAFTLDVYSHVLPHMQDAAAEKVQALLIEATPE